MGVELLVAFAGGVYGALCGGTMTFAFTGILCIFGVLISLASGDTTFLNEVAFGPFFGCQTAFIGGVAAAALAGRLGYIEDGSDCNTSLYYLRKPELFLIAGVFGVLGQIIYRWLPTVGFKADAMTASIFILGIVVRWLVAGDTLFSKPKNNDLSIWQEEKMPANVWISEIIWAFFMAFGAIWLYQYTGDSVIGWGLAASTFIFYYANIPEWPIMTHVVTISTIAYITYHSVWLTAAIAIITILVAQFIRIFTNTNAKSHIDVSVSTITVLEVLILQFLS